MKPILRARLTSSNSRGLTLDCGDGAQMRIAVLADDLVRVTVLRGGEVRQKRTWAVPAFGQEDTDWAGRARLDDSSWPAVAPEITASPTHVALTTRALRLSVTLDGFRMDWALPNGAIFARDRGTQPYFLGQKTYAFKHAMARAPGDRHYGLGDRQRAPYLACRSADAARSSKTVHPSARTGPDSSPLPPGSRESQPADYAKALMGPDP